MAIHPIEYRYGTPEMREVWSDITRFKCIIRAEIALAHAQSEIGMIPVDDARIIEHKAESASFSRVKEIESQIHHDTMAVVQAISEVCGEAGRWIHYGATSNDILDTATGLQLQIAFDILEKRLLCLLSSLIHRANETKRLVCIARTHGQHGVPTTYGLRFAIWASEISRHIDRLHEIKNRVVIGQMTGATGTMAAMGKNGIEVQSRMMKYLGIGVVDVSNQVISRDRYAEYIFMLANIATTLDKIGIEIRSLQRTEIGEIEESFGDNQVGSSTMPHKRNPIKSEQICGLSRIIRAMIEPALLNNTLWDERDLTNSSCERITFSESTILCDHCLKVMIDVLESLVIKEQNIRKNLNQLHGINLSESVMIELTKRGMPRQTAHELIRKSSMSALKIEKPLIDILSENSLILEYISKSELNDLLNPDKYIGLAETQVDNLITKLTKKYF